MIKQLSTLPDSRCPLKSEISAPEECIEKCLSPASCEIYECEEEVVVKKRGKVDG